VYASANYPGKLSAKYGEIASGQIRELVFVQTSASAPAATAAKSDGMDIGSIDSYFASLKGHTRYFVFTNSMVEYAHYFGYLPDGTLQSMRVTVSKSPAFQLWYTDDGITIYRYVGLQNGG
jgi:hypothetical protein